MIGFVARETFNQNDGQNWVRYISFSKLNHLKEVVSLDVALCPHILREYEESNNLVPIYFGFLTAFDNLDRIIELTKEIPDRQILAVLKEPDEHYAENFNDERFQFMGFDLVEEGTGISALLNCGGFEGVFEPIDLSQYGLIEDYQEARRIQDLLVEKFPDETHADCDLWAIWRMNFVDIK